MRSNNPVNDYLTEFKMFRLSPIVQLRYLVASLAQKNLYIQMIMLTCRRAATTHFQQLCI